MSRSEAFPRRGLSRSSGFTLPEVLVATFLVAIVMASVFGALHYTRVARDVAHNLSETHAAGPAVLDRIERDLRSILLYNVAGAKVFLGRNASVAGVDADAIDFVAAVPSTAETLVHDRRLRSPVCEVGYHLRQNPLYGDLLELWRREDFFVDEDPFRGGTWTLLYDRIKFFNVTYYADLGLDAEPAEEWSSEATGRLPRRIQIDLEIETQPRVDRGETAALTRNAPRVVAFSRTIVVSSELDTLLALGVRPTVPRDPGARRPTGGMPTGQVPGFLGGRGPGEGAVTGAPGTILRRPGAGGRPSGPALPFPPILGGQPPPGGPGGGPPPNPPN